MLKSKSLLEEKVKELKLTSIGLHVFGHNTIAINLYQKMGFDFTNHIMKKELV
ncbi:MAG: GNAT family N-acetyltransferase [Halobacteriovoraceae bacterium]|jgi:ribosomal protein S18 acetylase RimI-like enzyme|nr:GNAT family N-acetyltransferase [Halobacteriovoraceae bacterium]